MKTTLQKLPTLFLHLSVLLLIVSVNTVISQNRTRPNVSGVVPNLEVNSYTGNLLYKRTDFVIPGRGFNMNITFSYNSGKTAMDYGYGCGWTFSYNLLYEINSSQIVIYTGDGDEQTYSWNGTTWDPEPGLFNELSEYQPGKFRITTKQGTKYFFDDNTHKKVTKIEDRYLNVLLFSYSGGKLTTITNACGKVLLFTWDGTGHLEQITDTNNGVPRIMKYKADLSPAGNCGELAIVINPMNDTTRYDYGIWHNLRTITDARSKVVNIQYNPDKAVSSLNCPETDSMKSFTYDTATRITTVEEFVTSWNRITHYAYDMQGRVSSIQPPTGIHSYTYDGQNNITSYTDPNGNVTSYIHDSKGNLLTKMDALGHSEIFTYDAVFNQVLTYTDKNGNTYTNSYDASGNLVLSTDPYAETIQRMYDTYGEITSLTDKNGNVTQFTYDDCGNIISITDALNFSQAFTWTAAGNISSHTNENGYTTSYSWDAMNRVIKVVSPEGDSITFMYDENSNLISRTDQIGHTSSYTYDALNRLTQKTDPLGNSTYIGYNEADNKISVTNPNGNTTLFTYNCCRLTGTTDPLGDSDSYTYDSNGNRISHTDKNGQVTLFTYDALNRMLNRTDPLGNTTSYTYDPTGNITVQTDPLGSATTYSYDDLNRLLFRADALGGIHQFTYDAVGNRISETDENGNTTVFAYDGMNRMISETNPIGEITSFVYDPLGNRNTITDANGNSTIFYYHRWRWQGDGADSALFSLGYMIRSLYDPVGNKISETDPNGNTSTFAYDPMHRMISETNALGGIQSYTYDAIGNILSQTDPNGNTTTYNYDALGRLIQKQDPVGGIIQKTYDPEGRLLSQTDANGNTYNYTYDAAGRLTQVTNPMGGITQTTYDAKGNITSSTDPNGNSTSYSYDALSRLITLTDPLSNSKSFSYDAVGNMTGMTDPNNITTSFDFDQMNRINQVTNALGGTTTFEYDAVGNRVSGTNPLGNSTNYVYDALGRLIRFTNPKGDSTLYSYDANGNNISFTNENGNTTDYTYDALNRMTIQSDPLGNNYGYSYDPAGNKISEIHPNGSIFTYSYDDNNRNTAMTNPLGGTNAYTYDAAGNLTAKTDALGNTVTFTFDPMNRLTTVIKSLGNTYSRSYDAVGNIVSVTDPMGHTTSYTYDVLNRPVFVIGPMGGSTQIDYDAAGNMTSTTDANGYPTTYSYDALHRPIAITNASGEVLVYNYNAAGNRTSVINANGNTTSYTYDPNGRLLSETSPLGYTTTFDYDGFGNRISETDANGNTTFHIYNELNHFIRDSLPDGSLVNYSYDLAGNITQIGSTGGTGETTTNNFDLLNRLTSVTVNFAGLFNKTTSYTYDAMGNRLSMTDPQGGITAYSWDDEYRLTSITDPEGKIYTYQYDASSRKTNVILPNGAQNSYSYDNADRPIGLQALDDNLALLNNFSYMYDAVGNKLAMVETTFTKSSGKSVSTTFYTYDSTYRLIRVAYPNADTVKYEYDAAGNRTQEIINSGAPFVYFYDADNRLTFTSKNNTNHVYNPNGNLIGTIGMAGNDQYSYDFKNRLKGITHNGVPVAAFGYSANGERLWKSNGGPNKTWYLYDYDDWWADYSHPEIYNPIAEYNMSGTVQTRYNQGPGIDQALSMVKGGQKYYYHSDDQGSPRKITNASSNVVNEYRYDAFGEILQQNETVSQPYRFTGREYDNETGEYYYRARYYNQHTGRYLTKDPWGMVNGPNTYLYALSNPVNLIDPSGLKFTIRTGNSSKPLRERNTSTINVFNAPVFEFEFQLSINANTLSYPSVQLGPIYMDQKAKKCWQSSTTRINEWKYKDNYWFYLALWLQVNIDPELKDKAAKAAEKASDLAAAEDIAGAISTGLGWIPGVSTAVGIGNDLASMALGEALNSSEAYEDAMGNLMDAMNGAYASVADWEFWYNNWQSDFEDVGYIIEGAPKEVCCPPSYDKTGGGKDGAGRDPITPKNIFTPGHGSYSQPPDILWDPPPGGYFPSKEPTTPSGPGARGILWDPIRRAPGGQNMMWNASSNFDASQFIDFPALSIAGFNPQPEPPAFNNSQFVDFGVFFSIPPNKGYGDDWNWTHFDSYSPGDLTTPGPIDVKVVDTNPSPGDSPDYIWKKESIKKYYYRPKYYY